MIKPTHHKAIVLDDVALDDLAVLLEEGLDVAVGRLVGEIADEDLEGAHAAEARHLAAAAAVRGTCASGGGVGEGHTKSIRQAASLYSTHIYTRSAYTQRTAHLRRFDIQPTTLGETLS